MVSVFICCGILLATSKPSCSAMSEPATPGNCAVRCTISLGVQVFLSGSPNSSERLVGVFLAAVAAATGTAAAAAGTTGADGADVLTASGSGVGGGGCKGLPAALNKSGMLSAT